MNAEILGQTSQYVDTLAVKGDPYDELESVRLDGEMARGRLPAKEGTVFRFGPGPDPATGKLLSGNQVLANTLYKAIMDQGFFAFTPLDGIPGVRCALWTAMNRTEGDGAAIFLQRRVFPEGFGFAPDFDERQTRQNDYWAEFSTFSKMSSAEGGEILEYLRLLKLYSIYGVSLFSNRIIQVHSMLHEGNRKLPYEVLDAYYQHGHPGGLVIRPRNAYAVTSMMLVSGVPIPSPASFEGIPEATQQYYISKEQEGLPSSLRAILIPNENLTPGALSAAQGQPYFGYSDAAVTKYINMIESKFASDVMARAVDFFFSMIEHGKQTDISIVQALYTNAVNMLSNIDNAIAARVPVIVTEGGNPIYQSYVGIPGAIRDPLKGYAAYYPRKRLSEIYRNAMRLVERRLEDTLGARLIKLQPGMPPPPIGTPETNIMLVPDPVESEKAGVMVYRDMSENPNLAYVKGQTITYGTRDDVTAYLKAFNLRDQYFQHPTGSLALSEQEKVNLGLTREDPLKKFAPLALLAAGAGYFLATR